MVPPLGWLVENWRLKLLAVTLALGLLGAVAFSQNPITLKSLPATIDYDNRPDGLVLVNPSLQTTVNVNGLAAAVNAVSDKVPNGVRFGVDLAKAKAGLHQTFTARPKVLPTGVNWDGVPVQVTLDIDTQAGPTPIDVEIRTPNVAPGWKVVSTPAATYAACGDGSAGKCQVRVTGPTTLVDGLKAYVQVESAITNDTTDSPSQPVRFEQNGHPIDLVKSFTTIPQIVINPTTVLAHVTAQRSQASRQVPVRVSVTGRQACGYVVGALNLSNGGFVTLVGPSDTLAKTDAVTLPNGIDISGATANVSSRQTVPTDPGVSAQPSAIDVVVAINRQFDCAAPTPAPPAPTPAPSPSPTR